MSTVAVRGARPVAVLAVAGATLVTSAAFGAGPANATTANAARAAIDPGGITVVAKGLDNPRHLVVDGRDVYVAEAGRGAPDPKHAPCVRTVDPETQKPVTYCSGPTGAITRIRDGAARRVVTGLPSVSDATGKGASGVTDLTTPDGGKAVAVVNLGADPRARGKSVPAPVVRSAGHLLSVDLRRNAFRIGTDVSAYEARHNPDHADPRSEYDSNPYAVAGGDGRGGSKVVVADAGGNDLLSVDGQGRIRLLALFPARLVPAPAQLKMPAGAKIPMQSVPNSVVRGPDGAWYVGELTGFPFVPGAARVWRVVPGHAPKVYASGFTNIIDLAFDRRGRLLVLEIASKGLLDPASPGALWQVDHGDKKLVTDKLTVPGGVAVGSDGAAYVTNLSVLPRQGQVLKVPLPR
jgi:hypothetical protein